MTITKQDIENLSELARLEFSEEEKADLVQQLNRILTFMEKIDELKLDQKSDPAVDAGKATPLREDQAEPCFSAEEALQNARKRHGDFFIVPKVVKKSS